MVEPKANMVSLHPFVPEAKAVFNLFEEKTPAKTNSSHQPLLQCSPTDHAVSYHQLGLQTVGGPSHYTERIVVLEGELHCATEEIANLKKQLALSERDKAQATLEFTNIKNLLDQISLVEHFAASDTMEVEITPFSLSWRDVSSGQLDTAFHKEVDRLHNELEAAHNLNSMFAAELDIAKQKFDRGRHEMASLELDECQTERIRLQSLLTASGGQHTSLVSELENAKKEIRSLRATLSDSWTQHEACYSELARTKEEVACLGADLQAAQNLAVELAHAKININALQENLEVAQSSLKYLSMDLLVAEEKISKLQSEHESSSFELDTAMKCNSALQAKLEDLRSLHEASSSELQIAKKEILKFHADYETSISECVNAMEETRKLQDELTAYRDSVSELRSTKDEMDKLQKRFELETDQCDVIRAELLEAQVEVEKLRAELKASHEKYLTCSMALFKATKDFSKLEAEHLASRESLTIEIRIAKEENLKLQIESVAFEKEKISSAAELFEAREEVKYLQRELEAARNELFSAGMDIIKVHDELSELEQRHGECFKELLISKEVSTEFQVELTQVQEPCNAILAVLRSASGQIAELQFVHTNEFESILEVIRALKEEICDVQADVELNFTTLILEKSLIEKKVEELSLELMAANEHLEKVEIDSQATITKRTTAASTLCEDLDVLWPELVTTRETEIRLEKMSLKAEELRSRMTLSMESMAVPCAPELTVKMDALHAELCAIKESEARYHEIVKSSRAEIEALKTQLCAFRDSEAECKESLVATDVELQKVKGELAIAKEALDRVGGDATAFSVELESLKAEVKVAKEREVQAKADLKHCSSTLHWMRIDLDDALRLADKARVSQMDLDDVTAKLEKAIESERTMAVSMVSLRAELNKAKGELALMRENNGAAFVEKDQRHDMELHEMKALLEAAVISKTTLKDANFSLNESMIKVMAEAEVSTVEAEKAREEVVGARAHIETIDAKLQALLLEVEAVKASEEWAFAQMRLNTIPEFSGMENEEEQGDEISISHEEYQNLKTKTRDLQELVSKRANVGLAQIDAAKASEREMRWRIQILEREVGACRTELNEEVNKREEAEAAKPSCEAALRAKRFEGKSLSFSGVSNGSHPMGKSVTEGRHGNINSICISKDSQSDSSSRSALSFGSCTSPGFQGKSLVESSAQSALKTKLSSAEKQRQPKFSSKIGAYFSKKKDFTEKRNLAS